MSPLLCDTTRAKEHNNFGSVSKDHRDTKSPTDSQYYAVIVACSQYENPKYNLPRRPFPPFSDSKLLVFYDALIQSTNWNESHIILLLNNNATKKNIASALEHMATLLGPNDFFLFSWNGHGTEVPDVDGDENKRDPADTFDEAICPYDVCTGDDQCLKNVITDDELGRFFSNITCKGMCLLFDCCLSGGMIDRPGGNDSANNGFDKDYTLVFHRGLRDDLDATKTSDVNGSNRVVLLSTEPELVERANYLTGFPLVAGMAFACTHGDVADRNNDGIISAEEAFSVARILVYAQSSVFWLGLGAYTFFSSMIKYFYGFFSFILTSFEMAGAFLFLQLYMKVKMGHFMGNFPFIQDDYPGELPLIVF